MTAWVDHSEPKCVVYLATNSRNGKRYVGATEKGVTTRRYIHFWNAKSGRSGKFYNAIRKHGEESFEFTVLKVCSDFFDALDHERLLIASLRPEYNLTSGGGGVKGFKFSSVSRNKMSAAKKGKPAAWLTGPNVGAIKAKLLARAQERPNRKPLASSHSLALTTAGNAKRRRRVLCITDGVVYESVTAASREYGITTAMICWYCSGRYKSRRGLQFRYLDAK